MRLLTLVSATIIMTTGCALFKVGGNNTYTPEIERSQQTAPGVVHLWKAELDSANYVGMTELMRHKNGRLLLAIERHELSDDLQRWKRIIGGKPITKTVVDTVSTTSCTIRLTVDYIRPVTFNTIQQNDLWFITSVE